MTATSARRLTTASAIGSDPAARRLFTVLLGRYGIPAAETVIADGADSAVEAAWWLGFPVTLVAEGGRLAESQRTMRCGLATPAQVRMAYRQLATSFSPAMTGVRLRRQPQRGAEVVVRVTRDANGRAQVWLLLGGPAGTLVRARVTRPAPLTARDAWEMLDELRHGPRPTSAATPADATPAADASRDAQDADAEPADAAPAGQMPSDEPTALDLAGLARLLERVSRLAAAVPQVAELELNPVIVTRGGVAVAGVQGRFRRSSAARPPRLRSVS